MLDRLAYASPASPTIIRAELIGFDTAVAAGITVVAYAPVLELCRQLVAHGFDPTTPLTAYRGSIPCLIVRSIGEAAQLVVEDDKKGTPNLRRHRNRVSRGGTASPIRSNSEEAL